MYLFDRIGYKVNEKKIEGYSYPGVATTIKGILTYPKYYPQGSQFAWLQDRGKTFTNVGNKERRKLLRDGHFSVAIPLSHIFGFCEYYKKVTYGYKHTLTLRRNHDNDAIIKSDSQEEVGGETRDKVLDGSIVINKLSWHMPHVILSDESQLSLLKDISNKVSLYIPYLNRQCERLSILQNSRDLDWKLNISAGSERPRYIFLGWCHTVTLFNTLSGRSRGKLTVDGQTGGQSEAHIDILPCNSFQHSARHTLFIRRCSDLMGCAPLFQSSRLDVNRMAVRVSALPAKRFTSVTGLHSISAGTCPLPLNVSLQKSDSVTPPLCFQEAKDNDQKVNPSNFDHLQVTNAYVQLNSKRYPEENLNINFNKNHIVKPYKMAADFHKIFGDNTTFSVDQDDYNNIYPIYAFDVSKQTERLKNSPIDVRISATFKDAVGHSNAIAYALILSDQIINLQSDGNKMIVY